MKSLLVLALATASLTAANWPQWLGPNRDGIWTETGIIDSFPASGPKVVWRSPLGAGYSGPAVANGKVFITDRILKSGASNPTNPFDRATVPGTERVLCLDEKTGQEIWKHEYDAPYSISYAAGPRTTPTVDDGHVYTIGAEGVLLCLDAATGKVAWSHDFNELYKIPTPLWGFSGHPLVYQNLLICLAGGNGSTAVAFDKKTGKEVWRALTAKEPGYCPPTLIKAGGKDQVLIWHPESINALNPLTGELSWSEPLEVQNALTVPTPRMWGKDHLFLTAFYNGGRMFKLKPDGQGVDLVWRSRKNSEKDTETLHSIMSTPFVDGDYIYGVCSYGQLRGLKAATGERLWETMAATTPDGKEARWAHAFLIKNGDRYFLWNEKGDLIIARLEPGGYKEISRTHLLQPTNTAAGRDVLWSHPAFANGHFFARNDKEIIAVDLRK